MSAKAKNILIQILKIGFSAALIFWLIQSGKLNFRALLSLLQPQYGVPALLLLIGNMILASERWRLLLETQSLRLPRWPAFRMSMIGMFFNFAMPGGVGGDLVKAFYFAKDFPESKMVAGTSVLMDRVLGLYSMIFMALIAMIVDWNHVHSEPTLNLLWTLIWVLFLVATVSLALVFSKKLYEGGVFKSFLSKLPLHDKFLKIYESLHLYGRNYRYLFSSILISILAQTLCILFMVIAGKAAGFGDVPLSTYFLATPLGFMAMAIPISPAGVGVGQAAFYYLFNVYTGRTTDLGPTTITAYQVGMFLWSLWGAYFYLLRKDRMPAEVRV